MAQKCHGNFNLFTAISVLLTEISICSRQFQFYSRQFQFAHGNFNLLTAISICSRQFQFTHSNFNLLTAISIYSRQFQLVHGNFNLLTAISIYSRQFQFFNSNAHGIFRFAHHLSTSAADSGYQKRKIKSRYLKSILFFRKYIKYLGVVINLEISHLICLFLQFIAELLARAEHHN